MFIVNVFDIGPLGQKLPGWTQRQVLLDIGLEILTFIHWYLELKVSQLWINIVAVNLLRLDTEFVFCFTWSSTLMRGVCSCFVSNSSGCCLVEVRSSRSVEAGQVLTTYFLKMNDVHFVLLRYLGFNHWRQISQLQLGCRKFLVLISTFLFFCCIFCFGGHLGENEFFLLSAPLGHYLSIWWWNDAALDWFGFKFWGSMCDGLQAQNILCALVIHALSYLPCLWILKCDFVIRRYPFFQLFIKFL